MPRQFLISPNGSTWVTGSAFWTGTQDFVAITFQGSDAILQFSGSSSPSHLHGSIRLRVSNASMPSDAATTSATLNTLSAGAVASLTTGSFSNGQTVYVKCLFYTGSGGTGNYDSKSATLTKSGDNTTRTTLIWRPLHEIHAWDGSAWRRVDTELVALPVLLSAEGYDIDGSSFTFNYTLDSVAPTGYTISVKTNPGGIEAGPFSVAGLSSDSFVISADSSLSYTAQLKDASNANVGDPINFTPFL